MRRFTVLLALLAALALFCGTPSARATGRTVVIVHGWNAYSQGQAAWDQVYGPLKAGLEAQGYTVYGPLLPYTGNAAGDSERNARWLKQYIDDNGLTDVVLVGHSLGAAVAEYYVRALDQGEVAAYATLDSSIENAGATGWSCLLHPPDLCAGSQFRKDLAQLAPRTDLFLLNVYSTDFGSLLSPDCSLYVFDTHAGMPSNPATIGAVAQEASSANPCGG